MFEVLQLTADNQVQHQANGVAARLHQWRVVGAEFMKAIGYDQAWTGSASMLGLAALSMNG